jgi:hypothetical protein
MFNSNAVLFVEKEVVQFSTKFTTTNRSVAGVLVHFKEMYNYSGWFKILITALLKLP